MTKGPYELVREVWIRERRNVNDLRRQDGTRLVLIRHGESEAQVHGFLSGHQTCRGLSELGRAQVTALRDRLVTTGEVNDVDVVYTSILARAIETAEIIRPGLGNHEAVRECNWCEIHAGDAEGLSWGQMKKQYPAVGQPDDPFRRWAPGAETWAEFYLRSGARLRLVAHDHPGQTVVVVGHGGIIGASFIALGSLPIDQGVAVTRETVNSSITEWQWTGTAWRLIRFNDADHLEAAG